MNSQKTVSPLEKNIIDGEELPEGWRWQHISDVGNDKKNAIVDGPFGSMLKVSDYIENGEYPVITITNIDQGFTDRNVRYISNEKFSEIKRSAINPGDIIMAKIGSSYGKCGFYPDFMPTGIIPANMIKISVSDNINRKFVYFFFKSRFFKDELDTIVSYTAQPAFSLQNFKKLLIPLPPLDEQQRIVAHIEALLTQVSAARDRLRQVPLIMKKFHQAVLAAACSGRLTEGWRDGNLSSDTSDQLIERVTQELQNNSVKNKKNSLVQLTQWNAPEPLELLEIPENWTWIAVKDATSLLQYGISVKSDSEEKNGIPILRMGNIQDGSIDLTDLKYIPANTDSISNFIVDPGDILFNRTNSPELVGKSAVYNEKLQMVFASYLVRVRPNNNLILSDYLCWWINSMWGREWARNVRTDGVSQSNINAQKLSVMPVPLPPLAEQHEIVRRVGLLFERADAFDHDVAAASRRCERLTQAVLGKAFRGELTTHDSKAN